MTETVTSGAAAPDASGSVTGGVKTLLRLEGLTLFVGMVVLYVAWDGSWWIFAILFFAPDLSFLGYLSGPRIGALIYNAAHSYMAPVTLLTLGFGFATPLLIGAQQQASRPRGDWPCGARLDPSYFQVAEGSGGHLLLLAPEEISETS